MRKKTRFCAFLAALTMGLGILSGCTGAPASSAPAQAASRSPNGFQRDGVSRFRRNVGLASANASASTFRPATPVQRRRRPAC